MAICEYFQQTHTQHPLLPKDPLTRAQIRAFCEVINSGLHPYQNLRLLEKLEKDYSANRQAWCKEWIHRGFNVLNQMIGQQMTHHKGPYVFGNQITLADVFLYPQVIGGVRRFGVSLEAFSHLEKVVNQLAKLKEFVDAEPEKQPDAV